MDESMEDRVRRMMEARVTKSIMDKPTEIDSGQLIGDNLTESIRRLYTFFEEVKLVLTAEQQAGLVEIICSLIPIRDYAYGRVLVDPSRLSDVLRFLERTRNWETEPDQCPMCGKTHPHSTSDCEARFEE